MLCTVCYVQIRVCSSDCTSAALLKPSHQSQPFWEMGEVLALAVGRLEGGKEDGEKEKHCQVRTACCLGSTAYPETWRTLEKMRHKETPDLHSVLWLHFLLCLFTHTLPSCIFVSFCVCFLFVPVCYHTCCSGSACFSNMFYVHDLNVFISGVCVSLSLTRWSQNLLGIQGKDSITEWLRWWQGLFVTKINISKNCLDGYQITCIGSNISLLYWQYQIIRINN